VGLPRESMISRAVMALIVVLLIVCKKETQLNRTARLREAEILRMCWLTLRAVAFSD